MRLLVRSRRDGGVLHAEELSLVAEGLAFPGLADDLERLAKSRLALPVWHAVGVVGPYDAAPADAEFEAALADVIHRGHLFGDPQRMIEGQHLDRRAHPEASGAGGDGAGHLERRRDHRPRRIEVDLSQPHAVDAPRLGAIGRLEDVPEGGRLVGALAHLLDEDPEMHGHQPPRLTSRAARATEPHTPPETTVAGSLAR